MPPPPPPQPLRYKSRRQTLVHRESVSATEGEESEKKERTRQPPPQQLLASGGDAAKGSETARSLYSHSTQAPVLSTQTTESASWPNSDGGGGEAAPLPRTPPSAPHSAALPHLPGGIDLGNSADSAAKTTGTPMLHSVGAMSSVDTLRAAVSALKAENAVLRQRITALTSSTDAHSPRSSSFMAAAGGGGDSVGGEDRYERPPNSTSNSSSIHEGNHRNNGVVPIRPVSVTANSWSAGAGRGASSNAAFSVDSVNDTGAGATAGGEVEMLRARVRRLESALLLEAAERDGLEKRVLAQERVLQDLQLRLLEQT